MKNRKITIIPFVSGFKGKYFLSLLLRLKKSISNLNINCIVTYENPFNKGLINFANKEKIKVLNFFKDLEVLKRDTSNSDVGIAVGFGYKIKKDIYSLPKLGFFALHDSLLPKMRGFAPSFWSLILGKNETGLTLFEISDEIDAGDILYQEKIDIDEKDDILTLHRKIFQKMEIILKKFLKDLENYKIKKYPQNHKKATYCMWRKEEDNNIRWERTTNEIWNLLRACKYPFWEAFTYYKGKKIYVVKAEKGKMILEGYYPGRFVKLADNGVYVSTGDGGVIIIQKIKINNSTIINANEIFKKLFDGFDGYI
ncbi:MAG: formyltransferase family protein [Nautiliaceae bacterium]